VSFSESYGFECKSKAESWFGAAIIKHTKYLRKKIEQGFPVSFVRLAANPIVHSGNSGLFVSNLRNV
jgi:hypothetical protein